MKQRTFTKEKKKDFRFDPIRGFTSLDGNGKPKYDIKRVTGGVSIKTNKTGKVNIYYYGKRKKSNNKRSKHNASSTKG